MRTFELPLKLVGPRQLLGNPHGRFVVSNDDGDWLGRWDTLGDAEAHAGEHKAMDREATLWVYDLAEEAM